MRSFGASGSMISAYATLLLMQGESPVQFLPLPQWQAVASRLDKTGKPRINLG
jgi:hypothetical protein